ncbi:hypothetical protein [Lelliottia sp.]|uniref:hypothetical protein n=1 Tax=Lelliottia sp. TaxID=1898429 RepID=UPI00388FD7EE
MVLESGIHGAVIGYRESKTLLENASKVRWSATVLNRDGVKSGSANRTKQR